MKNIILTILCSVFSFSFAQSDIKMSESLNKRNTELKKMAIKAVEFLDNQINLSSKQKAVLTKEYSRYANSLTRAEAKNIERRNNSSDSGSDKSFSYSNSKKTLAPVIMRLTEKRDAEIIKVLKPKQVKAYKKYKTFLNPLTLEVRSPKSKTKK